MLTWSDRGVILSIIRSESRDNITTGELSAVSEELSFMFLAVDCCVTTLCNVESVFDVEIWSFTHGDSTYVVETVVVARKQCH